MAACVIKFAYYAQYLDSHRLTSVPFRVLVLDSIPWNSPHPRISEAKYISWNGTHVPEVTNLIVSKAVYIRIVFI